MTLAETLIYINKALNYPAISIEDVDLYFNQAFSEINTQLHLGLPTLEEMRLNAIESVTRYDNLIKANVEPTTIPLAGSDSDYFYDPDETTNLKFTYMQNKFEKIYYMFFDNLRKKYRLYESRIIENGANSAWYEIYENPADINLEDYLPKDWIFLFIIPYVCFKRAVLDGDQGILFNNEMATGFNQLRDSYHIPEYVLLKDYIHLPAYTYILRHKPETNLMQMIPTRAIYDKYKIPKAIGAVYMDFYDKGGWGV